MTDLSTELGLGLQAIADAIAGKQCGCTVNCYCGSGGVSGGSGGATTGQAPIDPYDPQGDPPAGYDSWQEYYDDVCAKATWLINTINDDLGRMSTIQWAIATVATVAPALLALLLDPIPGDEIFALAGILIAIAAYGSSTLTTVKGSFNDAIPSLICALFTATGPEDGKSAALAAFREQIEGDTADPIIVEYGVQAIGIMLSWAGLNKVYSKQTDRTYPAGDCSECGEEEEFYISVDIGTEIGRGEDSIGKYIDVAQAAGAGNYYANLSLWTDSSKTTAYARFGMVQRVGGSADGGGSGYNAAAVPFSFTATAGPFFVPPGDPSGWRSISIGNVQQVNTTWRFYFEPLNYP